MGLTRLAIRRPLTVLMGILALVLMGGVAYTYLQVDRLPPVDEVENDLLENVACERAPNSRLSCQIVVTEELDGMVVDIPERQF